MKPSLSSRSSSNSHYRLNRRRFLGQTLCLGTASTLGLPGLFASTLPPISTAGSPSDLSTLSTVALARLIQNKDISALEAVQACLRRIESVNDRLNAIVHLCADRAIAEAKAADASLARGHLMGPLHGVPFTLKDSIETEGVITTAGSLGLAQYRPKTDATVAARLRRAGAILLGKSNTPEFTLGGATRGTWNLVYGQTNNPYNLAHTPRGSSGGAGAIVAAGGVPFDIGSDFGGSIRSPAHACGVVGIKPTFGRVPRTGHWPGYGGVFDSYQQLGPLVRYVADLSLLLPIISGPDGRDAAIIPAPLGDAATVRLGGLRVAFYTNNGLMRPTPETEVMVRAAATEMSHMGAHVTESFHGGDAPFHEIRSKLTTADGGAWMQRLLDRAGTKEPSAGIKNYLTGKTLPTADIFRLLEDQYAIRSRLATWFKDFDLILCPTNALPAPPHDRPAPRIAGYTSIYNLTGWPAAVVRCGTSPEGLPLGLQIVAPAWKEHVVLAAAAHLESVMGGWKMPML